MSQILDNRATELRLGAKGRRVFSSAGWNDVLRQAGLSAGLWWIANYLPLRWNKGYALGPLGYRPKGGNRKRVVAGIEPPFFETGQMLSQATGAKVRVVAKKGGARFWISVPTGHPLAGTLAAAFKTLPAQERVGIAKQYRRAIIQALQLGRAAASAKQQAKATARTAKLAATAARRAETRANRTTRRTQALPRSAA